MDDQENKNKSESFLKRQTQKGKKIVEGAKKTIEVIKKVIEAIVHVVSFLIEFWPILIALALFAGFHLIIDSSSQKNINTAMAIAISTSYYESDESDDNNSDDNNKDEKSFKVNLNISNDNSSFDFSHSYEKSDLKRIEQKLSEQVEMIEGEFSDFELAVLGSLMEGSDEEDLFDGFTVEELHCITPFIKAEACTQNLDLRPNSQKIVNGEYVPEQISKEELLNTNKVVGTIILQRTNTKDQKEKQDYKPDVLEYVSMEQFEQLKNNVTLDSERKARSIKIFYNK